MKVPGFVEIDARTYRTAYNNAWSVECMAGHEATGRDLEYIGSRILTNDHVYDFFVDQQGCWWYQTRKGLHGIGIVDMETAIFGPAEVRKTDSKGRRKRSNEQNKEKRDVEKKEFRSPGEEEDLLSQEAGAWCCQGEDAESRDSESQQAF